MELFRATVIPSTVDRILPRLEAVIRAAIGPVPAAVTVTVAVAELHLVDGYWTPERTEQHERAKEQWNANPA